jgi:hypothetical protein
MYLKLQFGQRGRTWVFHFVSTGPFPQLGHLSRTARPMIVAMRPKEGNS